MKKGKLVYDSESNRMDVLFENGELYGGLHCGTTLDVFQNGKWSPTRIEMGDDWYLVGIQVDSLIGLTVRI